MTARPGMLVWLVWLVLLALEAGSAGATRPSDPVYGYWLTENRRAIVEIAPCGEQACGVLVWTRRDSAACGERMIGDLERQDRGRWAGGYVRDPRSDKRYGAVLTVEDATRLTVRGYLGVPLLGRSQVWTRVDGTRGGC